MDDLEDALQNIDVFCRALVRKALDNDEDASHVIVEPIEDLFRKKYLREETETNASHKYMIPLPQLDEPLIDVFEHDEYFKVLMQCRCRDEEAAIHTDANSIKVCKKVCHTNSDGIEVCRTECKDINLPIDKVKTSDMVSRCNNNQVFEVEIPKTKP